MTRWMIVVALLSLFLALSLHNFLFFFIRVPSTLYLLLILFREKKLIERWDVGYIYTERQGKHCGGVILYQRKTKA